MTGRKAEPAGSMREQMGRIIISESHSLGAAEARRRVDAYADELAGGTFPGVRIEDVQKDWDGSTLRTSFQASKGFFSQRIAGSLRVEEAVIDLDVEVPDLVLAFVSRPQVESLIRSKLREKLA